MTERATHGLRRWIDAAFVGSLALILGISGWCWAEQADGLACLIKDHSQTAERVRGLEANKDEIMRSLERLEKGQGEANRKIDRLLERADR